MVRSRTDYILGTDRRLFKNVAVRDPRHNTDHSMVLGCLPGAPLEATRRYQGGRKRWPVRPLAEPSRTDTLFAALRRAVPKPVPQEARRNAWISAETWRIIDERVAMRQDPRYGQADRRRLGKEIGKSLSKDRRRRTEEAGAAVEDLMKADPPLIQEAWHRLQGWYKAAVDRPPTTRSSYAQAGNGGAGKTVQPGTPPRETPSRSQSNRSRWRMASPQRWKWSGR